MPKKLTENLVKEWMELQGETFDVRTAWAEIGIDSPQGKNHLRVILHRWEHQDPPLIISLGSGKYKIVDSSLTLIDWRSANSGNIVPLKWPFGLEKYISIYPKNVAIIAGAKQEGKTTFLYDFIKLNMYQFKIQLLNTETGKEQMKDRFLDLGIPLDAPFEAYERYDNFSEVIAPDIITVIDYLDFNADHYLAGVEIDRIFRKLTTGIAIIGMQIPPPTKTLFKGKEQLVYRDYAYGAGSTAKRAFVYLTLTGHRLKIKHAKKPAQKTVNPENMQWSYDFNPATGQFANPKRYYEPKELL